MLIYIFLYMIGQQRFEAAVNEIIVERLEQSEKGE